MVKRSLSYPSLHKWFGHDPERWDEFKLRYREELQQKPNEIDRIRQLEKKYSTVVLLYAAREALNKGLKRPGLFGTGFTMNASFYSDVFHVYDMQVVLPEEKDKEIINQKLFSEIELGIFTDETRHLLIDIIKKMIEQQQIDSIILGCTEFPLILTEPEYGGIPMLNTTLIHVKEIIDRCMN